MGVNAEQYLQRKLSGVCIKDGCARPQQETNLICEVCAADDTQYKREYYHRNSRYRRKVLSAKSKWRKRQTQAGRCQVCSDRERPLVTETMCEVCHERKLARDRKRRGSPDLSRHCKNCGGTGHDRRTCRKPLVEGAPLEYYATARNYVEAA